MVGTRHAIRSPDLAPQSLFSLHVSLSNLNAAMPGTIGRHPLLWGSYGSRHPQPHAVQGTLCNSSPPACLWTTSGRRTARVQHPKFDAHSRLHLIPVPQRLSHSRSPPAATSCCTTTSAVSSSETSSLFNDALFRSCLPIWRLYLGIALLRVLQRPKPTIQQAGEFRVFPPDRNTETACNGPYTGCPPDERLSAVCLPLRLALQCQGCSFGR